MKKIKLLLTMFILFFCGSIINVQGLDINDATQEDIDAVDAMLQKKLDEIFNGDLENSEMGASNTVTFKIVKDFKKTEFLQAVENGYVENTESAYFQYIMGSIIESNDMFEQFYFDDVDTGFTFNGDKVYAKGSFEYIDSMDTLQATYQYGVFYCIEEGMCGGTGSGTSIDLDVAIKMIEPNSKILANIESYYEKIDNTPSLKYDDLYWINMLLATDMKTIMGRSIAVKDAKYLTSFFTELEPNILMGLDNRQGVLSCVDCFDDEGNLSDEINNSLITEVSFSGEMPILYNDVMYDVIRISDKMYIYYGSVIKLPDTTQETNYISAITEKINKYINNSAYKVTVTKSEYTLDDVHDFLDSELEEQLVNEVYNLNIEYDDEKYDFLFYLKLVDEEDIEIPKVQYLDKETNILMETTSSDVPLNSKVIVEQLDEDDNDTIKDVLDANKVTTYDISLNSVNGLIKEIKNGSVVIKIPVPEGYNEKNMSLYYVSDDNKTKEKFEHTFETIDGKRYIVFSTKHFSKYVVSEEKSLTEIKAEDIAGKLIDNIKKVKNDENSLGLKIDYGTYQITIDKKNIKANLSNTVTDLSLEIIKTIPEILKKTITNNEFLIIKSKQSGELPAEEITISFSDPKFKDKNVNLYYFNEKTNFINKIDTLKVGHDYHIDMKLKHYSQYILTTETLNETIVTNPKTGDNLIFYLLTTTMSLIGISYLTFRKKELF